VKSRKGAALFGESTSPRAIPFLVVAPAAVILLGLAVTVVVAALGVYELREQRADAAQLRSQLLAETLAARLSVMPVEQQGPFVQQSARRGGADFVLIDEGRGAIIESSWSGAQRPDPRQFIHSPRGVLATDVGRIHYTTSQVGEGPRRVVALVTAPEVPFASSSLVSSLAAFATLLVAAAGFVAWALARDVHGDVMFVRTRIVDMARENNVLEGEPIPVRTIDQVGRLTSSFNVLLERFEAAERAYRHDLSGANAFDRDRSEFLAALSHELRTPLNAILGFTDVLLSEVDGPLSDEARENLVIVRASGDHLRSLIDDILALSAIESGELRLSRETADVAAIARDVVAESRVTASQKGLALELDAPPSSHPVTAHVDARRVRQVLGNVVSNAIKFTREGRVEVSLVEEPEEVMFIVSDTGPGIARDALSRIFDEYQQSGSPTAQRSGTGLGLAITRRLVQMHGGSVRVESELGQGARFFITLPKRRTESVAPLPPQVTLQKTPAIRER
jgi:signal transduction histidine kinase